jgi:hypothetical protein
MKFDTHYLKNNDFKTVQGNGVFGGLTNNGQINMSFYTDRAPIPKTVTLDVDPDTGAILGELGRESKEGIVREVHFGVLLDKETAKGIVEWLNEKIETLEG